MAIHLHHQRQLYNMPGDETQVNHICKLNGIEPFSGKEMRAESQYWVFQAGYYPFTGFFVGRNILI